jgi:hypothetical protein
MQESHAWLRSSVAAWQLKPQQTYSDIQLHVCAVLHMISEHSIQGAHTLLSCGCPPSLSVPLVLRHVSPAGVLDPLALLHELESGAGEAHTLLRSKQRAQGGWVGQERHQRVWCSAELGCSGPSRGRKVRGGWKGCIPIMFCVACTECVVRWWKRSTAGVCCKVEKGLVPAW